MLWASNYVRLAVSTMNVLFFAGRAYAPLCVIDGINIQDWLQKHYIAACHQLATRLAKAEDLFDSCVVGWDSLNEPNAGFVGYTTLDRLPDGWKMRRGPMPSPIQAMRLGAGQAQRVENYDFGSLGPKKAGMVDLDPGGTQLWLTPDEDDAQGGRQWGWKRGAEWPLGRCLWAAHGVWDEQSGEVLRGDYFASFLDRPVDFVAHFWLPHWRAYAASIRSVHREAITFLQLPVFEPPPKELTEEDLQGRSASSSHYYDGLTLVTKHWNWFNADAIGLLRGRYSSIAFAIKIGFGAIRKSLREQIGYLKADTESTMGSYPTLIGETGIPFDLDSKRAYYGDKHGRGRGDYRAQTSALDATLNACDGSNLVGYGLWQYDPNSTHKWGDGWNGEDLSVWSADDVDEGGRREPPASSSSLLTLSPPPNNMHPARLLDGSRGVAAFSRPYPQATVGTPTRLDFDIERSTLTLHVELTHADAVQAQQGGVGTVVFLPLVHYAPNAMLARTAAGKAMSRDSTSTSLLSAHSPLDSPADMIDVDVQVTAGSYEVDGQYLTWRIDPADVGEGVHSIVVKRQGGALELHRHASLWESVVEDVRWLLAL